MNTRTTTKWAFIILTILYLGICLRQAWTVYPFVDEMNFQRNLLFFAQNRTLIPIYSNYPTFYSYLLTIPVLIFYAGTYLVSHLPSEKIFDPIFLEVFYLGKLQTFLFFSRMISVLFGAATLILVYRRAKRIFAPATGLLAAGLLVLDPTHTFITFSRWALPEIVVTFLLTAAFFLLLRYTETKQYRHLLAATVLTGLAMGCKINAALMIPALAAAPLIAHHRVDSSTILISLRTFCITGIVFIISTPLIAINPDIYFYGFLSEKFILFGERTHAWRLTPLLHHFQGPGLAILFLFLTGSVYAFFSRKKWDVLLLCLTVPALIIFGALSKQSAAYLFFLYPIFAVQSARLITAAGSSFSRRSTRYATAACSLIIIAVFSASLWGFHKKYQTPDNRALARDWIYENIPSGTNIMLDWEYYPEIGIKRYKYWIGPYNSPPQELFDNVSDTYFPPHKLYNTGHLNQFRHRLTKNWTENVHYFVTADRCFVRYFKQHREAVNTPVFEERYAFYSRLFSRRTPFRLLRVFDRGPGPTLYIFKKKHPEDGPAKNG